MKGLTRDAVIGAARGQIANVLDQLAVSYTRSGRQLRTGLCPTCGQRSGRDTVAIDAETGMWKCHAHDCHGSVIDLVAGYTTIDAKRDFPQALKATASLLGVSGDALPPPRPQSAPQPPPSREPARAKALDCWNRCAVRCEAGEAYLAHRLGAAAAQTLMRDAVVRFALPRMFAGDARGPVLPLRDWDGMPVSAVVRRIDNAEPKAPGLKDCPTDGTLHGAITEVDRGSDVYIVEGFFDTLAAYMTWPRAVVLGAHGAGNLRKIVERVAPLAVARGATLWMVPHYDKAGIASVVEARKIAASAGLALDVGARMVDLGEHKDLADAYRAGVAP